MRTLKHLLSSLILLLFALSMSAQTDFEIIKKRIVDELMKPRTDDEQISGLVNSVREDGTWPGIDYEDLSRTGFQHMAYLKI